MEFPFTHNLRELEELCANNGITILSELDDLDLLTPYAARAPHEAPAPATVDRKTGLELASAAREWWTVTVD